MVKHIVLYTLKEGVEKDGAVALIASCLEPFHHLLQTRVSADYEV